ncbi:phenoloxidase-activating factor 3-like [Penaeus japonicus]|uniref:phenoloxidase-activating factor 3-like n=1 Tax=Penaeus japonicus TaxID=27405 RepID=UPI001C71306B|nr:phenoloxidase-activating factor 3-like [Penaeus japonicus]
MVNSIRFFPKGFLILLLWHLFVLRLDTASAVAASASAVRTSRQASRCLPGSICTILTSCPDLLAVLENPTPSGIRELQQSTCGFAGRVPKVCCRNPTPGATRPLTPATKPPPPPISPTSTATTPTAPPTTPHAPEVITTTPEVTTTTTTNTNTTTPSPTALPPGRSLRTENENLLPEHCGFSPLGLRISRGKKVRLGAFPWMAVLGFQAPGNDDPETEVVWGCGGSLINKRYVLTAAHCTIPSYNDNHTLSKVRLGEHDLRSEKDCKRARGGGKMCSLPPQTFGIEEVVVHHTFNHRAPESDDIALLRLDRDVEMNTPFVQPICLPAEGVDAGSFTKDHGGGIIAGWGITKTGHKPGRLLTATVPHVPLEVCRKNYRNALLKEQLCFGGVDFKDSCSGDSGGPLFQAKYPGAAHVQLGIVSYGYKNCGTEGVASVYTNVASYRKWILKNLKP